MKFEGLQRLLIPLCQLTWPTTSWLSCHYQMLLHFYHTADCRIIRSQEVLGGILSQYHSVCKLNSTPPDC